MAQILDESAPRSLQYANEALREPAPYAPGNVEVLRMRIAERKAIIAAMREAGEELPDTDIVSRIAFKDAEPETLQHAVTFLLKSVADVRPYLPRLNFLPHDPVKLLKALIEEFEGGTIDLESLERMFSQAEDASCINGDILTPTTKALHGMWDEIVAVLPQPSPEDYGGTVGEITGDYGRLYHSRRTRI